MLHTTLQTNAPPIRTRSQRTADLESYGLHASYSTEISRRVLRRLLEALVAFVVFEGLLRRAFPSANTALLMTKFVATAGIVTYFLAFGRGHLPRLPIAFVGFIAVTLCLTLVNIYDEPRARIAAIAVNMLFVPLFYVGAYAYNTLDRLRSLMMSMCVLTVLVSAIGIVQLSLPRSHWSVIQFHGDEAIRLTRDLIRVPGTFQYCNTFSQYLALASAFSATLLFVARSRVQYVMGAVTLVVGFGAALSTGGRAGSIGMIVIALAAGAGLFVNSMVRTKHIVRFAVVAFVVLGAIFLFRNSTRLESLRTAAESRSLNIEKSGRNEVLWRLDYYLNETLGRAATHSEGIGVGWGVYTVGIQRFRQQKVETVEVEGGYSVILAESGVLGIPLFVLFLLSLWILAFTDRSIARPCGFALATALVLVHFPAYMLQKSVIAIPWWIVLGAYFQVRQSKDEPCRS